MFSLHVSRNYYRLQHIYVHPYKKINQTNCQESVAVDSIECEAFQSRLIQQITDLSVYWNRLIRKEGRIPDLN